MSNVINMQDWFKKKESDKNTKSIIEKFKEVSEEYRNRDLEQEMQHSYPSLKALAKLIERSSSDKLD